MSLQALSCETYSWFPRYTGGDNNDIGTSQGLLETVIGGQVTSNLGGSGDVGEIGGDTGGVDNIEKAQLHIYVSSDGYAFRLLAAPQ